MHILLDEFGETRHNQAMVDCRVFVKKKLEWINEV